MISAGRLWRRGISVSIFITVKKISNVHGGDPVPSPTALSPLLNNGTLPNALQQSTSDSNPVQENSWLNFASQACNSLQKASICHGGDAISSPSTTSSSPLLNHEIQLNSLQHTSDTTNPVQENCLLKVLSKTRDSFKKASIGHGGESVSSSPSSSPSLNHDTELNSLLLDSSDTNNLVRENAFSSINSFKDQSTSASCDESISATSYDPVPSTLVIHGLERNLSAPSQHHVIDMPSNNVEEEVINQQQRAKVIQIVKERDLNSLKNFGGVKEVASIFGSHWEDGIPTTPNTQEWDTHNVFPPKGFPYYFLRAGNKLPILFLFVSAVLSFVTEIMEQGTKYGWLDGATILFAVFLIIVSSSVANFLQERKTMKQIQMEINKLAVKVVRNKNDKLISISNLVAGDIVVLEVGDQVPADGLVVSSDHLKLDRVLNSTLDPEINPFISYGSKVMQGQGKMLVTSVGVDTTLCDLLSRVIQSNKTTLAQIDKPNSYIEDLSLFVSILTALATLILLLFKKKVDHDDYKDLKGNVLVNSLMKMFEGILLKHQGRISVLPSILTVVVVSIQHGMPFVITLALTWWKGKVELNRAGLRNLSVCPAMGIVTVICIDATVRLMCQDLQVNKFLIGGKDLNVEELEIDPEVSRALQRGLGASLLLPCLSACPTNSSLVSWASSKQGMKVNAPENLRVHGYQKLISGSNCCGILMIHGENEEKIMHSHWSGAASSVLDMCSHYYDINGTSHSMRETKSTFEHMIRDMEGNGLRPFAFACGQTDVEEIQEQGLHLLAIAGLKYPCSGGIRSVVNEFKDAGVSIKLVSEDELSVVKAIAYGLGLIHPNSDVLALEGEQMRDLSESDRMQMLNAATLMGNCIAEDKLLLVKSVKQEGHIVAYLGGSSSSDSPALKEADVGISGVAWHTEMARESSDIVIWTESSLITILQYGRCAYYNIQKFSQLQLTVCFSGLLITTITTMSLGDSPISALQMIWVYWITCILGGVMMIMELQVKKLMSSPLEKTDSLLSKAMWKDIIIQVICQASVLVIFLLKHQIIPSIKQDVRKATVYNGFTLAQVFYLFYILNLLKKEVLLTVLMNIWFFLALVIISAAHVLLAKYLNCLAHCVKLNGIHWGVSFVLASLPCGIHVAVNFISLSLSKAASSLFWSESSSFPIMYIRVRPRSTFYG